MSVNPVNEDAPVLSETSYSANIAEDLPLGTLIYDANATDSDLGDTHGDITYSVLGGDTIPNSFIVDPGTGKVRVFNFLDYDTQPQVCVIRRKRER